MCTHQIQNHFRSAGAISNNVQLSASSGESRAKTGQRIGTCALVADLAALRDCRGTATGAVTLEHGLPDALEHLLAYCTHNLPGLYWITSVDDLIVGRSTDHLTHLVTAQTTDA